MSITQQYALDVYRARQHGEPLPPAPGRHDWQVVREFGEYRRFRAVLTGRPAHGRLRRPRAGRLRGLWSRWAHPHPRSPR
ncbi:MULTISPECIES: hypothetical protein [unclassified Streptomyces]|uniref:hypothetical protein n=1 Tax=unclassified Streptomyces TaxID=2593676 RepID=UPI00031CE350|nr:MULTISPECIES: hypothetical protein [unclassified Streptomyces]NED35417.1 hypothetical protein [Streptomyces sp. SID8499]